MQFFNTLIDTTSQPGVAYIGKALPGSWEDSEVWKIKKITTNWTIQIKYAHWSSSFVHKWSDRLLLDYN